MKMDQGNKIKSFSQIIGQEAAVSFLKRMIASQKIPHAFLFTGIAGVGKTTAAMAFCQALNCLEPVNGEGCGNCRTCRQLTGGNFPDFLYIEPDGQNVKIEQIRELNRAMGFKPVAGSYRVVVIDRAELMTVEAANSFLKTLEEPSPGNVIILKVKEPLDLLPTIVSRCQKIPFRPLPVSVVKECLMNEPEIGEESAVLIAGISDGSLGRAMEISKSGYLEERQRSINDIIQLSAMQKTEAMDLAMDYAQEMKKKDHDETSGMDLFERLGIWKTWYRDLIIMKINGPAGLLVNADFSRKLKALSKNYTVENLLEGFARLDRAQMDLTKNPNIGLMMEDLFLSLVKKAL
jgi:DNA polymerase III subunit delta'